MPELVPFEVVVLPDPVELVLDPLPVVAVPVPDPVEFGSFVDCVVVLPVPVPPPDPAEPEPVEELLVLVVALPPVVVVLPVWPAARIGVTA